jgi:hypothetical protein
MADRHATLQEFQPGRGYTREDWDAVDSPPLTEEDQAIVDFAGGTLEFGEPWKFWGWKKAEAEFLMQYLRLIRHFDAALTPGVTARRGERSVGRRVLRAHNARLYAATKETEW